jgi:hypothetical protein
MGIFFGTLIKERSKVTSTYILSPKNRNVFLN